VYELDRATTPTVEFVLARTPPERPRRGRQFFERVAREPCSGPRYRLLMPDGP